jgi:3-hydroxyisobutyrate dehydrogenase-like beta-hydroxyacid dehydrogenase
MPISERIGFLGLGGMGMALASNLLADGYPICVWNRTAAKTDPLRKKGAEIAATAADAVTPGGIVFSIVADDRALEEICLGSPSLAEKLGHGGVHVSMSTIAPATAKKLSEQHARFGATYIACPVFGRPSAVAARQMFICTSGPTAAKERINPILKKLGQGVYDFGEDPSAANVVKLAGNFMIAACTETLAEAAVLCEESGVPAADALGFLTATYFNCPAYKNYAKKILDRSWSDVGFTLKLGFKDMNLVSDLSASAAAPMPILSLLRDRYLSSIAQGLGDMDWSTIAQSSRDDAGLK